MTTRGQGSATGCTATITLSSIQTTLRSAAGDVPFSEHQLYTACKQCVQGLIRILIGVIV